MFNVVISNLTIGKVKKRKNLVLMSYRMLPKIIPYFYADGHYTCHESAAGDQESTFKVAHVKKVSEAQEAAENESQLH